MKESKKLPLIYLLGMPIALIIANFMARFHIEIFGSPLYFSVLLYPLTYLFSGMIVKKAGYKKSLLLMSVTLVCAALTFVVQWSLLSTIDNLVMIYSFLSFLICQLIFIYTYDFLIKMKKDTYGWVFLLVLLVSANDNAFFGAMIEGQYVSVSILIRLAYTVIIPVVLARKGVSKKKKKKKYFFKKVFLFFY